MTFSIVGRCEKTGQLGVAISSSSIAVGARCPWVRAGVGVVSTQTITLPALGPRVLDLLRANGQAAVKVFVGGIIPERDVPALLALGVTAVYGPGTATTQVVDELNQLFPVNVNL